MEGFELPREVMTDKERKFSYIRDKLILLRSKISDEKEPGKSEIVDLIDEMLTVLNKLLVNETHEDFIMLIALKIANKIKMEKLKKRFPELGHHCSDFEHILIRLDFLDIKDQEKENLLVELSCLFYKLKNIHKRKMSEDDEQDFQKMSEILIKYLPILNDPCPEVDDILYKNDTIKVVELEKNDQICAHTLLINIDVHDFFSAYYNMIINKNVVNQCLDNAFLKLVEQKARTKTWHLNKLILELLESKIMHKICIGLKIFKTYFNANGFKSYIGRELCYAVSDLSKIPYFVDQDENKMARFLAKHAQECHDLIEKESKVPKLPAYTAYDIFMEIKETRVIGQNEMRAFYEIIKSGRRYPKILSDLEYGSIPRIVHAFLLFIRRFYERYEELDEEMREMDAHNGEGFGEFLLELVADDDKKKPLCASDGLEKSTLKLGEHNGQQFGGFSLDVVNDDTKKKPRSTLNKYLFYDDAMKTLSMLSFLYNCVENFDEDKLKHFKIVRYVTEFVITLIHQRDLNMKIDKPIWIMEKILKTCHFIVFGDDEKEEKDIFLRLMDGKKIEEEDLSCLKNFMKKNNLSYREKQFEL